MKKILSLILTFLLLCLFVLPVNANPQYNQQITVKVNGTILKFPDAKPYISSNSKTMVPISFIANALNLKTTWNNKTKKATITDNNNMSVILKANSINGVINGQNVSFEDAPVIRGNRLFVPVRFISETFGAIVGWDESNFTVNITTPYHYVEKYYYFNDIKIQVKGGDQTNNDSTGRKIIRTNTFEIKEEINSSLLLSLTIRRDVSQDLYVEQIKEFTQILELNNFSKDDIQYLTNEILGLFDASDDAYKTYNSNGYKLYVEAFPYSHVSISFIK